MSTISIALRTSLWRANRRRCFYCEEPISYVDLEIDHLIPRSISSTDLDRLKSASVVSNDFQLEDPLNLVPTHHGCNRRKSRKQFSDSSLRFYFETWSEKQNKVASELAAFRAQAEIDELLVELAHQVAEGGLSRDEVVAILDTDSSALSATKARDPIVIGLSVNTEEIEPARLRGLETSAQIADRVEADLLRKLRATFRRPFIQSEASERTGETISIRLAVWDLDIDRLSTEILAPWELLEVATHRDVYGDASSTLFARALDESFNILSAEDTGCPICGGNVIVTAVAADSGEFAIGTCEDCDWEGYHPM